MGSGPIGLTLERFVGEGCFEEEFSETEFYRDKSAFFQEYFLGSQRIRDYDKFIRKRVSPDQQILSVGSGRCVNELRLIEDGFEVACSDLPPEEDLLAAKTLFPDLQYTQLDILSSPSTKEYDIVLSLSLIYLFDDRELSTFFQRVSESLGDGGHLILDSAGSPDNFLSYLIHDVLLKHEPRLRQLTAFLLMRGRREIVKNHHGYRRTDQDVLKLAQECHFELLHQENFEYVAEFGRSIILRNFMRIFPPAKLLLGLIGRSAPYIRMYDLRMV